MALGEHWGATPAYLPAQVTEADVQLVFLAGLPLVSAAVFCMDKGAEEQIGGKTQEARMRTHILSLRH